MVGIVFSGMVLIATNTVLQAIRERQERRALERKTLDELLHPLLDATDDLVSRLTQFIANRQVSSSLEAVGSDPFLDYKRLRSLHPDELAWRDVTMYRLLVFLHYAKRLNDGLHKVYFHPARERIRFILGKIRTMAGGRLYDCNFLGRELQQLAGELFDELGNQGRDPTVRELLLVLRNTDSGGMETYLRCGRMLNFESPLPRLGKVAADELPALFDGADFRSTCALAHVTIYLIDFFESFARSSKYSVERLVLVQLLKTWNQRHPNRHSHLYHPRDINPENRDYLESFPLMTAQSCGGLYLRYWKFRYYIRHPFNTKERTRKLVKKALWWRAKKDAQRHNLATTKEDGVVIKPALSSNGEAGQEFGHLNYADNLGDTYDRANEYWKRFKFKSVPRPAKPGDVTSA